MKRRGLCEPLLLNDPGVDGAFVAHDLIRPEEQANLPLRTLTTVGRMNDVPPDGQSEIGANGPGSGLCRVRLAGGRPDDQLVRLSELPEVERLAALREDGRIIPGYLDDPALGCYALMVDDVPVASAVVIADGDMAVVEYVHTLERYRRLGYGRWLMRGLQRLAANAGARWVVLSSNERGRPLYDALGYQLLSYEDIYRRQDLPSH